MLSDVPQHLQNSFARVSEDQVIVKWVAEESFTAVRRTRIFPLGRTDWDRDLADRTQEVTRRYKLALEFLNLA